MAGIMIFTGKGGVGKSSIASAHALESAKRGTKTLLVSTDMAHNLGDIFGIPCDATIHSVREGLDILEIDPDYEMHQDFSHMVQSLTHLFPESLVSDQEMEELLLMPGMLDLFSLLKILDLYEEGHYARIIVDCAPTGETLALLKFPELLSWYMEKLFPIGRVAMRVMSPISKGLFKVQLPDGQAMNDIERLYLRLSKLQTLLKDPTITSVRIVTLAEKMVVEETKRSYMYLNLYGFHVDGIIVNRLLPEAVTAPFFDQWKTIQGKYLTELAQLFPTIPTIEVRWYDSDLQGQDALVQLAEDYLGDPQLFDCRPNIQREVFTKIQEGYTLTLYLPFAQKGEIRLHASGTDLTLRIGNFKRSIPLPTVLLPYSVITAKMDEDILTLTFKKEKTNQEDCHE